MRAEEAHARFSWGMFVQSVRYFFRMMFYELDSPLQFRYKQKVRRDEMVGVP